MGRVIGPGDRISRNKAVDLREGEVILSTTGEVDNLQATIRKGSIQNDCSP